jgi:hypothetical protein
MERQRVVHHSGGRTKATQQKQRDSRINWSGWKNQKRKLKINKERKKERKKERRGGE